MVASNRTHVSVFDTALAGADLTENWQNAVLSLHTFLKAAGFTVEFSSDGVTADVTGDNVSVVGDVVSAAPASPHTWIQYDPPAIMGNWKLLLDCNDPDATPREIDFFGSSSGYNADGDKNDRPTPVISANEWTRTSIDLIPSASFVPMSIHHTRASDGELIFCISIDGTQFAETGLWIVIPKNGDDVSNAFDYGFYFFTSAQGAFVFSTVAAATSWRGHAPDGTDFSSMGVDSIATKMGGWAGGVSNASGDIAVCPVDFVVGTSPQARYVGRSEDHRAAPALVPQAIVKDGDVDVQRRVIFDSMWIVVQSSALPINF